jgi:trigger factor
LVQQAAIQLSRQGIDISKMLTQEIIENMRERSRPEAIDRLRRTLALGEVAKQESIKVEEDDVAERMQEMLDEVSNPEEVDRDRLREVVNEELLQEKILKWLVENNTVEMVPEGTLAAAEEADDESEPTPATAPSIEPVDDTETTTTVETTAVASTTEEE